MDWLKLVHGTTTPEPPAVFRPGDEVRVWYRILEQGRERLGQFEGTVIRYRGRAPSRTFTVRRVTHGEGVERVFPIDSKTVARIEVLRQGKVKRSRLYFLRSAVGKRRIAAAGDTGASGQPASTVSGSNTGVDADAAAGTSEGLAATGRPAAP